MREGEGTRRPWRRGAIGSCRLSRQLLARGAQPAREDRPSRLLRPRLRSSLDQSLSFGCHDDLTRATDVLIVAKLASVCGHGKDCASALSGSGGLFLFAEYDPFCALQACFEGVQVETVMSVVDIFVSPTGCHHFGPHEKLKFNTFVGNTGHFDNEVDLACSEGFEATEVDHIKPQKIVIVSPVGHGVICCITPLALQIWRFKGFLRTFPRFQKKVRSSAASAEMTRQVDISKLSAHQMAHGGVVPHSNDLRSRTS